MQMHVYVCSYVYVYIYIHIDICIRLVVVGCFVKDRLDTCNTLSS